MGGRLIIRPLLDGLVSGKKFVNEFRQTEERNKCSSILTRSGKRVGCCGLVSKYSDHLIDVKCQVCQNYIGGEEYVE